MTCFRLSSLFRVLGKLWVLAAVTILSHPVFGQTITTSNLGVNQVTLGLTASSSGTGSFTLLTGAATCGAAAQTVQGKDSSGANAYRRGSLPLVAGVAGSYTVRNLTASTTYTVCFTQDGISAPVTANVTTGPFTQPSAGAWASVGPIGFSSGQTGYNTLAIAPDGTLYVAYSDLKTGSGRLTVEKFNGTAWVVVGSPDFSAGWAQCESLAFAPDGTPYVAYQDFSVSSATTVQRFDGTDWQVVGAVGFSSYGQWPVTSYQSLAFAPDGTPYVAYYDGGATIQGMATVSAFIGGAWRVVGARGFSGGAINWISLAFAPDGSPWVAIGDNADKPVNEGAASVLKFDGTLWSTVGPAAFSGSSQTGYGSLAFSPDGTPYVAYADGGNSYKATVRKFDGVAWEMVGTALGAAHGVLGTSLAFAPDGSPFLAYPDDVNSNNYDPPAAVEKFDGTSWTLVGAEGFSQAVFNMKLLFGPDGIAYAGYEDDAHGGVATVSKFAPLLTISPGTLTFPSTAVGSVSAAMTATISYTGSAAIYLTKGSLTDSSDFTQSDNCGGIVAANSSCTVSFTFTPQTTGSLGSTYAIADMNDQGSPLTVNLGGTGTGGYGLKVAPASIVFPNTSVGSTSVAQTATLTLAGGSSRVSLTTGSLTDATDFTQSDNCGGSISPNGSCTVTFTFTPKSVGALSSTYSIGLQGGGSAVTVVLSGNGAGDPQPTFTPASLSFTTTVGTQADSQSVTLSNAGNMPLAISSLALTGTNSSQFAIGGSTCGSSLASGSNCTIPVSCTATAFGSYSASLTLTSNATPATQSVSLSCAVNGAAAATLTPATASFGSVTAGSSSSATVFTLSSTGNIPLSISSIALAGANASSFNITANTCGASLAVGGSCTVSVVFSPTAAGSFTASLRVTDGAGAQTSALAGAATPLAPPDFTLSATPASQSAYRGTTVAYTLNLQSVTSANPYAGTVALVASGLPLGATASFASANVAPGISTPTTTTMTVTVPALRAASMGALGGRMEWPSLLSLASLAMLWRSRRHKSLLFLQILLVAAALSAVAGVTGCGANATGFAIPSSTSNITITGTGSSATHSTTVTLTIQ